MKYRRRGGGPVMVRAALPKPPTAIRVRRGGLRFSTKWGRNRKAREGQPNAAPIFGLWPPVQTGPEGDLRWMAPNPYWESGLRLLSLPFSGFWARFSLVGELAALWR